MNVVADIGKRNSLDFRIMEEEAVDDGTRLQNQSQLLILVCKMKYGMASGAVFYGIPVGQGHNRTLHIPRLKNYGGVMYTR